MLQILETTNLYRNFRNPFKISKIRDFPFIILNATCIYICVV